MSIRKHLPDRKDENLTNIQVKMETALVERVKTQMKKDRIVWSEFFSACFHAYLEESESINSKLSASPTLHSGKLNQLPR